MYNKKDEVQILSLEMVIISRFISFRCLYIPASAEWKEQPNRGATAQTGQVHAENRTSTGQVAYGSVGLLYPDSPRHPRQKYLLTVKGLLLWSEMER